MKPRKLIFTLFTVVCSLSMISSCGGDNFEVPSFPNLEPIDTTKNAYLPVDSSLIINADTGVVCCDSLNRWFIRTPLFCKEGDTIRDFYPEALSIDYCKEGKPVAFSGFITQELEPSHNIKRYGFILKTIQSYNIKYPKYTETPRVLYITDTVYHYFTTMYNYSFDVHCENATQITVGVEQEYSPYYDLYHFFSYKFFEEHPVIHAAIQGLYYQNDIWIDIIAENEFGADTLTIEIPAFTPPDSEE